MIALIPIINEKTAIGWILGPSLATRPNLASPRVKSTVLIRVAQ